MIGQWSDGRPRRGSASAVVQTTCRKDAASTRRHARGPNTKKSIGSAAGSATSRASRPAPGRREAVELQPRRVAIVEGAPQVVARPVPVERAIEVPEDHEGHALAPAGIDP